MEMTLTHEQEEWIGTQIKSGKYQTPSEAVEQILREARLARLREELQVGLDQIERGEVVPGDDALFERIKQRGRQRLKRSS